MSIQPCRGADCQKLRQAAKEATRARRALRRYQNRLFEETVLRRQAEEKSLTDPLTGAFNRRGLEQKFGEELSRVRRFGRGLHALFIDVDDFKLFNSNHGEQTGDRVLCKIVETIKSGFRPYDSIHRVGGEEFVVLLPEIPSLKLACIVAERIRKRIASAEVMPHDGEELLTVTVSIGIAALNGTMDLQGLIDNADRAEREAKKTGKNCTCIFLDGNILPTEKVLEA